MNDAQTVAAVMERLMRALDQLEIAVHRHREGERARADVDAELAAAQDDRQRLAAELDAALSRSARLDAAATEIDRRLEGALAEIAGMVGAARPGED